MEIVRTIKKQGAKNREINESVKDVLITIAAMRREREAAELAARIAQSKSNLVYAS